MYVFMPFDKRIHCTYLHNVTILKIQNNVLFFKIPSDAESQNVFNPGGQLSIEFINVSPWRNRDIFLEQYG